MDEDTSDYIKSVLAQNGNDAWWYMTVEELLPAKYDDKAAENGKGTDTLDVWLDSELFGRSSKRHCLIWLLIEDATLIKVKALNIHMDQPNFGKLTSLHFYACSKEVWASPMDGNSALEPVSTKQARNYKSNSPLVHVKFVDALYTIRKENNHVDMTLFFPRSKIWRILHNNSNHVSPFGWRIL